MDGLPPWLFPLIRDARVRTLLAVLAAAIYYLLVVTGEVGRSGSIIVTAVLPALSLPWFRTRPALSMGLAAAGMLLLAACMVNGYFVQDVTQQSAVLVAIFGGALSAKLLHRRFALALALLTALLASAFALASLVDLDSRASKTILAVELAVLPFAALVLGTGVRLVLHRGEVLGRRLTEVRAREEVVERDVAIEQERNRVARDVHDVVAHSLAVVIAQADGARYAIRADPRAIEGALDAIGETARTSLAEVRTLLHELRHVEQPTPAPGAVDLDGLFEGFRDLGLNLDVVQYGHQRVISPATELALFRIMQESLTNALRHGDLAQPVRIDFDWGDHAVAVVLTNALRKAGEAPVDSLGHGLPGMRERAVLAGGDFSAGVSTRGLFRIRASLPVALSSKTPALALTGA